MASATGQALGLLQLVILFLGNGPTSTTDYYFLLYAWSQAPYQILLNGTAYPLWVRGSGGTSKSARRTIALSLVGSMLAPVAATVLWVGLGRDADNLWGLAAAFAAQGVAAAGYWVGALWVSAHGDASFASGATIIPNGLGCLLAVLASAWSYEARTFWLVLGPAVGFALTAALLWRKHGNVWRAALSWEPPASDNLERGAGRWFGGQAVIGYGSLLAMQSITATMPASSMSLLGSIQRVQAGLTTTAVNASLPRLIHANSESSRSVERFLFWSVGIAGVLGILGSAGAWIVVPSWLWVAPALTALFSSSAANACARRVASRFMKPSWSALGITTSVAAPIALLPFVGHLTIAGMVLAYTLLELVPALILSIALGWHRVAGILTIVTIGALVYLPTVAPVG